MSVNFLRYIILLCSSSSDSQLRVLRLMLGTFDSLSNFSLIHMAFSSNGNSCTSASYHLLHGMLEWRWIHLSMLYKIDYFKGHIGTDSAECVTEVSLLVYDLITLSLSKFLKCNSANLIFTSPFVCSCVKEMWLLLYSFMGKLQDNSIIFWDIISTTIGDLMCGRESLYRNLPSKKILARNSSLPMCNNVDQFSLWLISGVINLVGNENSQLLNDKKSYDLYEGLVRNYLKADRSEESMRVLLLTISQVILRVWLPRSDLLMLLWECFQKKINSPFLIAGQSPNFMAVSGSTVSLFLEQIKTLQNTKVTKLNVNLTSYGIFVFTLGKMVEKLSENGQKVQIQRILGRIYTKFPTAKLKQLNEMGVHNVLKLFITLSLSTSLSDISTKVTDTLLQIPIDKPNNQQLIMKGHIAMLILYCENNLNITQYLTRLMAQINFLMEQQSSSMTVLKILSESLPLIVLRNMNTNAEIFENGEDILIDVWIIKFLQSATTTEQDRLYEALSKIIQKIRILQASPLASSQIATVAEKICNLLLPHTRQHFGKVDSVWMPEMTANLCFLTSESTAAVVSNIPKFENLFKSFMDSSSSKLEQSIKFITVVLKNRNETHTLDTLLIMQNWIRFSVLLGGSNQDLKELTKNVISLSEFSALCQTSVAKKEDFLNSKEPLCLFISDIGKKYVESDNQQKFQLMERVHSYFSTFEKWAVPYIQQMPTQKGASQNSYTNSADEFIMRIYTFIAITFLHCSELIFIRTKTSCFFNVAVSHFILPSTLMMGQQSPPRSIIASIHKVWPLLIEGTSRLNYKSDHHINKVLSDIVVKWAPLLRLSSNPKLVAKPFLSVSNFKNLDLIEFFWMKLSKSFLILVPGRKVTPHCCMILTVIEEVLHNIEAEEKRAMAVWRSIMQQIIELAMQLDETEDAQKKCFSLIERYLQNKKFETSITMKGHLVNALKSLTDTSLSYHSVLYFR
jgi:hypothetical protein